MAYMDPRMVLSPKGMVSDLRVLHDGGEQTQDNPDPWSGWSLAEFKWDGEPAMGTRWNGGGGSVGNPQSRGVATWHVLPSPLAECARQLLRSRSRSLTNGGPKRR
jgi:hypothetical protein